MKVVIIGGGASGIFCSGLIASYGHSCVLLEKNERLGKKLYITGKGRCNLTNDCEGEEFFDNIVTNSKFLRSAISKFSPKDTIDFVTEHGLQVKTERGNRVFPASDKANDVINCFEDFARKNGVRIYTNSKVTEIVVEDGAIKAVKSADGRSYNCDAVVVATGGASYPFTGSEGDGYGLATQVGHNLVELRPALAPMIISGLSGLAGVSLKNIEASISLGGKEIKSFFGEMLFTHEGVSGPVILSLSSYISKYYKSGHFGERPILKIDLKPALDEKVLDDRLLREFEEKKNMEIKNIMPSLVPKALGALVLEKAGIEQSTAVNQITKLQRESLVKALKGLCFKVESLDKIAAAIVTGGGVDVKEINPKNMQSKLVDKLFFAGEVIDIDALTGGFNIQLALSTAYAVAEYFKENNA